MAKNISLDFVIEQDLPNAVKAKAAGGYNITCPFCNGKNKFHIDTLHGVARCAKCGDGESVDGGHNSVTLHAKLTGLSTKDAYKDLCNRWKGLSSDVQVKYIQPPAPPVKLVLLPECYRNEVNNNLLNELDLCEIHKNDLLQRGLSESVIKRNCYRSIYNNIDGKKIARSVAKQISDKDKKEIKAYFKRTNIKYGVPGFINFLEKEQEFMTPKYNGYLIPVKNLLGEIQGFQIRNDKLSDNASQDEKYNYAKYTWLSTSYDKNGMGISDINNIHHTNNFKDYLSKNTFPKTIYLTEGPLKADIAAEFAKRCFIALPGVSNVSKLPSELETLKVFGAEQILVCLDMDYRNKKEVKMALKKIISIIRQSGLSASLVEWDEKYKGIDDFLLARENDKTLKLKITKIF